MDSGMILYLLTGVIYGYIEVYVTENGFVIGVMDFFGFKKAYHGTMLLLALVIGLGMNALAGLFWWVLLEDLSFWASSKWLLSYKYKLTEDSWIANKLGSLKYKSVLVPIVHVVLFVAGYLTVRFL